MFKCIVVLLYNVAHTFSIIFSNNIWHTVLSIQCILPFMNIFCHAACITSTMTRIKLNSRMLLIVISECLEITNLAMPNG
jgi:hypothetical protein